MRRARILHRGGSLTAAFGTAFALLLSVGLLIAPPVTATDEGLRDLQVAAAVLERATYGLQSDPAALRELIESGRDAGTAQWGIVVSAHELAQIDFPARMAFVDAVKAALLPYAEQLDSFGGAYFDQARGGRLVILLTQSDPAVEADLSRLIPSPSRGVSIEYVANSQSRLRAAVHEVVGAWAAVYPGIVLLSVAVDTPTNALRVDVSPSDISDVAAGLGELSRSVRVPIFAVPADPNVEVVCTTRDNCYGPMKAGIRIRKGSATSQERCTFGFHTTTGSGNETFITAGHCGWAGSNSWWHIGYGMIGQELKTQYEPWGRDAMMVEMADIQASTKIFGEETNRNVVGYEFPTVGQPVCASLAESGGVDCGVVADDYTTWTGDACNCTIVGGDVNNIISIPGDSGSPIYARYTRSGSLVAEAIGILNTGSGKFAVISDVLFEWGDWIYTN